MVVAAGAANGQTQKGKADIGNHFRDEFLPVAFQILIAGICAKRPQPGHTQSRQNLG